MEITKEIKAKVFAQYLGQEFIWTEDEDEILEMYGVTENIILDRYCDDSGEGHYDIDQCKLLLTPLSKISDEDAIEVAKIGGFNILNADYNVSRHKSIVTITERRGDSDKDSFLIFLDFDFGMMLREEDCTISGESVILIYQFLQSHGYDLPNYYLGGQTLIEAGLAVEK